MCKNHASIIDALSSHETNTSQSGYVNYDTKIMYSIRFTRDSHYISATVTCRLVIFVLEHISKLNICLPRGSMGTSHLFQNLANTRERWSLCWIIHPIDVTRTIIDTQLKWDA